MGHPDAFAALFSVSLSIYRLYKPEKEDEEGG